MDSSELYLQLEKVDHSMGKRELMAEYLLLNPSLTRPMLELAFQVKEPLSVKACWVLEYAVRTNIRFLDEHLDYFIGNLALLKDESSIRPMAKICEALLLEKYGAGEETQYSKLTEENLEKLGVVCFDWLIGPHKVATKAFAMTSLYELGKTQSWIHPELQMVLEKDFASESAAFKARARHILKKLSKQLRA